MGNRRRVKRPAMSPADQPLRLVEVRPVAEEEVEDIFLAEVVLLTDELIAELEASGWSRAELEYWRERGAAYNRRRRSLSLLGGWIGS